MRTATSTVGHARLVEEVVSGQRSARPFDVRVRESWRRCLSDYRLSPDQTQHPAVVSIAQLRQRRDRADPLCSIARIEMAALARLLNAPVGVMLTDHEGVILGYTGAANFAEIARRAGLREGAIWSEAAQGTNGMGTCLAMREPVLIEADEHFLAKNVALTCCGAPILDSCGQLVGALNISGHLRLSAAPTLALVRLAVQNIENRALLAQHRRDHLLRFHPHREFISTAGEGILAIAGDGRVVGANMAALEWLGVSAHSGLCGQWVEQLFGLDLAMLETLQGDPASATPLPQRDRGSLCYGIVQRPQLPGKSSANAAPAAAAAGALPRIDALAQAERKVLREVLESCRWNVSLAAMQLNISRRTLHRKLKAHGMRRYSAWDSGIGAD
ncbi:MAG TPA: helix-turn-helix domain-containing protein [Steroidobacteraceae bacterium]|nr:helix-turn-helix domain-containing protein [Steroidobacteraceae bacterium]